MFTLSITTTPTTFTAARWVDGVGQIFGTFANTADGVLLFARRVQEQADPTLHMVLEPQHGNELLLLRCALDNDWPLSVVDPACFRRWARAIGAPEQAGSQGAILLARYTATLPLPIQQPLPAAIDALQGVLCQHSNQRITHDDPQITSYLAQHRTVQQEARRLETITGITPANALPILVALHRWSVPPADHTPNDTSPEVLSLHTRRAAPLRDRLLALRDDVRSLRPLALATIVVTLALRVINLKGLPADLYGDIAIIIDYVHEIIAGHWPTYFILSSGPLYHYLITPVVWVTGLNYLGLKLASVLISLVTLFVTYLLGRDLLNETGGLLAAFTAGVSSWLLVFSRLGNSQIIVPLLAVSATYLALRAVRLGRRGDFIACGCVSALGLYIYPQTFIQPLVTGSALVVVLWLGPGLRWKDLAAFVLASMVCALPFVGEVVRDPDNFTTGYIGDKMPSSGEWLRIIPTNLWNQFLALYVRGDETFRSNPNSLPHLDLVSGVLLLVGMVFWLRKERRWLSPLLFAPFVLLQLPAVLVRYTNEVPSASRTLGIVPIVFVFVASGLWWLARLLRSRPLLMRVALTTILVAVVSLNSYRYFVRYADAQPNHNTAFGDVIAAYINTLPPQTTVLVVGCCWGDAGQPHPYAIQYAVTDAHPLQFITKDDISCEQIQKAARPTTLIWSAADALPAPQLADCFALPPEQHQSARGDLVFHSVNLASP